MAKRSMLEREKKRARIVQKFANKRAALKAVIKNLNSPDDERWDADDTEGCQSEPSKKTLPIDW